MLENTKTLDEVSAYLGITERTVRRYLQTGKLKGYKIGGRVYITNESLTEFIEKSYIDKENENHE